MNAFSDYFCKIPCGKEGGVGVERQATFFYSKSTNKIWFGGYFEISGIELSSTIDKPIGKRLFNNQCNSTFQSVNSLQI